MKNNWPDHITIEQYLQGTLDKGQMHELEKRALDDPFLADALEGYHLIAETNPGLSILQRQLHKRIMLQQENKKVFDLSWQRLSVAAAAAVMFISACVLFWMNSQVVMDKRQALKTKQVEISITLADDASLTKASKTNLIPAQPVDGWEAYTNYMRTEAEKSFGILTEKGKVAVGFKVDGSGDLYDFRVIQGLSPKADSLAIRIVRSGPVWRPSSELQESSHTIAFEF